MGKLDILCDGKLIYYSDAESNVKWKNVAPTVEKWESLGGSSQDIKSLAEGIFLWLNGMSNEEVTVVFCPYKGLDFNLVYSTLTGELIRIHEAR
ncbi:hypothetical protein [Cupriavidus sp. SW-Y-13]|uniref:hypothetical protein n=1 Tax=Cupriavidus sp. SW-Y-13 TaxID=2653854 RepID=UPI001365828B|nr:hypothetical protein [Cupriavidus sp. SW-Y-13]MWL91003.1 hypothetical protein [Cupriavidus sp. SW-Y-13]